MDTAPSEIAQAHLKRLKDELGTELSSIEEKIAESEANVMTRRNRIEELASVMNTLTNLDNLIQDGIEIGSSDTRAHVQILSARQNLKSICEKTEQETFETNGEDRLISVYNNFRIRLMNTLNALDLVAATMRKRTEGNQRKAPPSQRNITDGPGGISKGHLGSSAIIRSQELERQRIAREIHDGPAQAIANVVLRMDIMAKVFEKDPSRAMEELTRMRTSRRVRWTRSGDSFLTSGP
jgi:signal transduction histidine kinase